MRLKIHFQKGEIQLTKLLRILGVQSIAIGFSKRRVMKAMNIESESLIIMKRKM